MSNKSAVLGKLKTLTSELIRRANLAGYLGKSFSGDRDIYSAVGYPTTLTFRDYAARYQRQDIAKRIVNAYPDATWRRPPQIVEDDNETETPFETAWNKLVIDSKIFHYVLRADRLAGVGEYAVLLLGFDDGKKLTEPVGKAKNLLFLQPYDQECAPIHDYEKDPRNPRYGHPTMYNISIQNPLGGKTISQVHYSRVIHIADNSEMSDVFGTPRLQAVYNRLQDIETVVAGSAEMFWKGGFPGFAFEAQADADMSTQSMDELQDEIEEYTNRLRRYMRLQGVNVKELTPQIADPSKHIEVQVNLISSATGIPKRILMGSELGKLASEQDKENWRDRVDERRLTFAEPVILRPLVDRCIDVGVLPKVDSYKVKWPEIDTLSEAEEATISKTKAEALAAYSSSPESMMIFPPFHFYTKVLGMTAGEANQILKGAKEAVSEMPDSDTEPADEE